MTGCGCEILTHPFDLPSLIHKLLIFPEERLKYRISVCSGKGWTGATFTELEW